MSEKEKKAMPKIYTAIRDYLEKNGWNVVVIGGTAIEQRGRLKYNFTFTCDFTGGKKLTKSKNEKIS